MTIYQRRFISNVRLLRLMEEFFRETKMLPICYDMRITQNTSISYRKDLWWLRTHKAGFQNWHPEKRLPYCEKRPAMEACR